MEVGRDSMMTLHEDLVRTQEELARWVCRGQAAERRAERLRRRAVCMSLAMAVAGAGLVWVLTMAQ